MYDTFRKAMYNLERPYEQTIVNEAHALLIARYDAVLERLLYADDGSAYTVYLQQSIAAAEIHQIQPSGQSITLYCNFLGFSLEETIVCIENLEATVAWNEIPTPPDTDLRVVTAMESTFDKLTMKERLQYLLNFGLVGARNKPSQEQAKALLEQRMQAGSWSEKTFLHAVKALQSRLLHPSEEEALRDKLDRFRQRLDQNKRAPQAVDALNRYYQGRLARQVLEGLVNPATTSQSVADEIAVSFGHVEVSPQSSFLGGQGVPVIKLPWPFFPRGHASASSGTPPEPAAKAAEIKPARPRRLDAVRTAWIGALAAEWPHGGAVTELELHNSNENNTRYQGAVLFGPDQNIFAVVADTDIAVPENALFIGVIKRLRTREGVLLPWKDVFGLAKGEAMERGVKRFSHIGEDLYVRALRYLHAAFLEQFGYQPEGRQPMQTGTGTAPSPLPAPR